MRAPEGLVDRIFATDIVLKPGERVTFQTPATRGAIFRPEALVIITPDPFDVLVTDLFVGGQSCMAMLSPISAAIFAEGANHAVVFPTVAAGIECTLGLRNASDKSVAVSAKLVGHEVDTGEHFRTHMGAN